MIHHTNGRLWGTLAIATVAAMGCFGHRHTSSVPCVAQIAPPPPPPPRADGAVVIHMREMRGLPDQYPLGLVVDGRVRATFADSSEVARLDSTWSDRFLKLAEIERIDVFRGDSIPAQYKARGLKQVYVFSTCRARERK